MTINRIEIATFGGISDLAVSFRPGLNVILGDNESGKSTLFRAIQHTLLTRTDLDKRSLRTEMNPFFPRPGGNFAESALTISVDTDRDLSIRKRWGEDAEEEATRPDGSRVRGPAEVSSLVEQLLPVSPATFRALLLADQSSLDRTRELLGSVSDVRDETAAALRRARAATGGVAPEAFARRVSARLATLLGRWDWEKERPVGGRGLGDRWKKGAGLIVNAYYEVKAKQERVRELEQSELALDESSRAAEEAGAVLAEISSFLSENASAYSELNASRGLEAEVAAANERIERLRTDNRRWPVVLAEIAKYEEDLQGLEETTHEAEKALATLRTAERASLLRQRLAEVDKVRADLAEAEAMLEKAAPMDGDAVARLREVEQELPYAEARLAAGSLRVSMTADETTSVTVETDGADPEEIDLAGGESSEVGASRRVVVHHDELRLEIEAGEERFADLKKAHDALTAERETLTKKLGVASASDAESRARDYEAAASAASALRARLCELLEVSDTEGAEAARNELAGEVEQAERMRKAAEASRPGEARAGGRSPEEVSTPSADELTEQIRTASEERGSLSSALGHRREEIERLVARYRNQEELEDRLGETNRQLAELQARNGAQRIPPGFESAERFLEEYESQLKRRDEAARVAEERRISHAQLVAGQAEETALEVQEDLRDAEREFEQLRREAATLLRVRERASALIDRMDGELYQPFAERVAAYADSLTAGVYVPQSGADPVVPGEFSFADSGSPDGAPDVLPYELLSQGTRDSLALAVRLALAETALGDGSAPFILDDPLVDMDPDRRRAAASAITDFAAKHQVILFTCHPEHASLFDDRYRSPLALSRRYVKQTKKQTEQSQEE